MRHLTFVLSVSSALLAGCAHQQGAGQTPRNITFDALTIVGDTALDSLNDEELFAAGTSYYAAEDYAQAARYFGRLCDFFPQSVHRRAALYNAGLALEKLHAWDDAWARFQELADPAKGTGDALDASYRLAETLYHAEHYAEAVDVLSVIADRADLPMDRRIEARVQKGVCELEQGQMDVAEATFRGVLDTWKALPDPDLIDDYFPAQAQFFLGEIFRLHYESVELDGNTNTDKLAEDLEYKSELLLSAQGHYLRAIRIGNGYWATASGQRIGNLYENMYQHMTHAPAPSELSEAEQDVYRTELRKKIRVLISKAITVYERTLEAAERIGASSPFVVQTRESLKRMKELLLAEARADEGVAAPPGS